MSPPTRNDIQIEPSEHTPLLPQLTPRNDGSHDTQRRRWPNLVTLLFLLGSILLILSLGFFVPAAAKTYAAESMVIDVSNIFIYSYTENGANVHISGNIQIKDHLVENIFTRNLGRLGTSILRNVHLTNSTCHLSLPAYADTLVATAEIPAMTLNIRNGRSTKLDIAFLVEPSSPEIIVSVVDDYIQGTLDQLMVHGEVIVGIGSSWLRFGPTVMVRDVVLKGMNMSIPKTSFQY